MKTAALVAVVAAMYPTLGSSQTVTTMRTETVTVEAKPTDVLSRNVVGLNIRNLQQEEVGEIQDVLLSQGKVGGYIVSVGGFLGLGERYVILAPEPMQLIYSENSKRWTATMDITKDAIKNAPAFKYDGRWAK